jgi:nitroreductase
MMSKFALRIGVLCELALNVVYGFRFPFSFLPPRIKSKHSNPTPKELDVILRERRTINNFEPTLPNDWEATIEKAIESAIYAPNHKRTEPWRFHLLGPKSIRQICELNADLVSKKKGEKAGQRKLERWLTMPGWVVVTCVQNEVSQDESMDVPSSVAREDYAACCCAVQNMCLSLHNSGMGTKWTTGAVNFDSRFNDILGLEEREYVIGTIWFGVPTKTPDAPPKKLDAKGVIVKHE